MSPDGRLVEYVELPGHPFFVATQAHPEFTSRLEEPNPLFRGFGNQSPEEVERYDKPVLVRLNTKDQQELSTGFPQSAEELYRFHAVIVDDLEADFFTADQQTLLQNFVSERGGGLLMLGGMESFAQGKYQRTPRPPRKS